MYCKECGCEIKEATNVQFCPNCGKEVEQEKKVVKKITLKERIMLSIGIFITGILKHKKKIALNVSIIAIIFVSVFSLMDGGTAWRLMREPNVKKVIWAPCWDSLADEGMIRTSNAYSYSHSIFHDTMTILFDVERYYGSEAVRLPANRGRNLVDFNAKMVADYDKRKQEITFVDFDGKEHETIDVSNIMGIDAVAERGFDGSLDYKKGLLGNNYQGGGMLSFRTGNLYNSVSESPSDGYCLVRKNNLYGYIDEDGNERISPRYTKAGPFINGWAKVVKNDGTAVFIDKNGEEVFNNEALSFEGGYNDRYIELKYGIIDREGNYMYQGEGGRVLDDSPWTMIENDSGIRLLHTSGTEYYIEGTEWDLCSNGWDNISPLLIFENNNDSIKYMAVTEKGGAFGPYDDLSQIYDGENYDGYFFGKDGKISISVNGELIDTQISGENLDGARAVGNGQYGIVVDENTYFIDKSGTITQTFENKKFSFGSYENPSHQQYGDFSYPFTSNGKDGCYDIMKGEILPAKYECVYQASPNMLLVEGPSDLWSYVVLLKDK